MGLTLRLASTFPQAINHGLRSHRTVVGHTLSDVAYISSGVVQGSCLGPLLFMAALCNRGPLYFCPVISFLLSSSIFFSFLP